MTEGYIKAMERFGSRIKLIGHPCSKRDFAEMVDIRKLAEAAKERSIPLEVNGANLVNRITDLGLLDLMLRSANTVVVNSDAHTNYELKHNQDLARNYLKEKGYIR